MTYTKLIERLREYKDYIPAAAEAADAFEALQEELSTLDVLLEECKMDWSGDVTQLKAEHKHEIEALQSKLGDAIQSSAHWQHQFTEAQAENERLKSEREALRDSAKEVIRLRDQLQSQLDAMGMGEPVGFVAPHELKDLSEGFPATVVMFRSNKRTVPLYAAPKSMAPLTDEQMRDAFASTVNDPEPFSELVNDPIWQELVEITRAIERAHGIGTPPSEGL